MSVFLVRVACWAGVLAVAAALVLAVLVPRLGGGTPYAILTGSMSPALPAGTLVVTRPVRSDLGLGTVVTYQRTSGDPTVVTHRVVAQGLNALGEPVVRTQGDANPAADPGWIRPVQIRGEHWYHVPYLGHLNAWLPSPVRRQLHTGIVALLLAYAAAALILSLRDHRRLRAVPR